VKKKLRKRGHLEDLGVDGRIVLKFILNKSVRVGEDRIDLEQCRDNWRVHSNAVIFGFYKILGIS
jgi:hypothetical protein